MVGWWFFTLIQSRGIMNLVVGPKGREVVPNDSFWALTPGCVCIHTQFIPIYKIINIYIIINIHIFKIQLLLVVQKCAVAESLQMERGCSSLLPPNEPHGKALLRKVEFEAVPAHKLITISLVPTRYDSFLLQE